MYRVYWTNFQYYAEQEFNDFLSALEYGKSKCMEFMVLGASGRMVASWSPIGGVKNY